MPRGIYEARMMLIMRQSAFNETQAEGKFEEALILIRERFGIEIEIGAKDDFKLLQDTLEEKLKTGGY